MLPLVRVNWGGLCSVGQEDVFQLQGVVAVLDHRRHLFAEQVAAGIDVAGAHYTHAVVADDDLRVHISRPVEREGDTRSQGLGKVAFGGQLSGLATVAPRGEDDAHVDSASGGGEERVANVVGGDEVGRLEPDVAFGAVEQRSGEVHDCRAVADGPRGDDAYGKRADGRQAWKVGWRGQQLPRRVAPVGQEAPLHGGGGGAFDTYHRVAPAAPGKAVQVAVGDVEAADVGHAPIDDNSLAVVAIVVVFEGHGQSYGPETSGLNPLPAQVAVEWSPGTAHEIVVHQPGLHPCGSAVGQGLPDVPAGRVVLELKELCMNMVAGRRYVVEQAAVHGLKGGVGLDAVARQRLAAGVQRVKQGVQLRCLVGGQQVAATRMPRNPKHPHYHKRQGAKDYV